MIENKLFNGIKKILIICSKHCKTITQFAIQNKKKSKCRSITHHRSFACMHRYLIKELVLSLLGSSTRPRPREWRERHCRQHYRRRQISKMAIQLKDVMSLATSLNRRLSAMIELNVSTVKCLWCNSDLNIFYFKFLRKKSEVVWENVCQRWSLSARTASFYLNWTE